MSETERTIEILSTVRLEERHVRMIEQVSPCFHVTVQRTRKSEEVHPDVWKKTEILMTDSAWPGPGQAEKLKYIQFYYAGVDSVAKMANQLPPDVQFSTGSGVTTPQVAEYVVAMLLAQSNRIRELLEWQVRSEWATNRAQLGEAEFYGSTVGIIGYGSIGREVARLLKPFNVKILAAKRNVMNPTDKDFVPEGMGDPDGLLFDRLYPIEAVGSMMKECDFVVVSIPLSPDTRGVITEEHLRGMKPTAFLVDISRGGVIDPEALITALEQKWIAGAALDVFTEEPLPSGSRLWKLPNTLITPHIAGFSSRYTDRLVELFCENLKRYMNGVPLHNLYQAERGY